MNLTYYLRDELPQEEDSKVLLKIADSEGNRVAQMAGPTTAGLHRVAWDLRGSQPRNKGEPQGRGRGRRPGLKVQPGQYRVSLTKVTDGVEIELGEPQTVEIIPLFEGSLSDTRRQ